LAAGPDPATAGLPFDPNDFESRLTWIFGSPRTGSTWLLRLLVHPWWVGHSNRSRAAGNLRGRRARERQSGAVVPIEDTYFPRHLTPFQPMTDPEATQPEPDDLLFNTRNTDRISYCFSDAYEDVWRPELRRLILVRLHAEVQRTVEQSGPDAPLVAVKETTGSYGAEFLMSLLPRAKLIFLCRDGRDVLDSQLALRTGPGAKRRGMTPIHTDRERLRFVRTQARLWVNNMTAVEAAYDRHEPTLRMRVEYEGLRADTFNTLKPLVDWFGSGRTEDEVRKAVDDNAFEALPRIKKGRGRMRRTARPGLWRQNLSPDEQRIATEVMGQKLESLGYEL
jgi:hypothetical protein